MAHHHLIPFDRPLLGATLPGGSGRCYTEAEVNTREQVAFRRGVDETRAFADREMLELRSDLAALSEGVLQSLAGLESALFHQLREQLPGLAVEIGRLLLAGCEPPADIVAKVCAETLEQLFPERENLELSLSPRDVALLDTVDATWKQRYPGLRIVADPSLSPGDCLVRSRFGLTDARQSAKLTALRQHLVPAVA